ncbi:TM2 domain-containing protein [bacterium]|nr:TM2 domain-containing protein [bacterium]
MSEEMKKCPFCGGEIMATAIKCKHCGEFIAEDTKSEVSRTRTCPFCGEIIPASTNKCTHCGEVLADGVGKSWVKTLLLCSFLGLFGAHSFYNKKIGIGIAQLLTFGGLGIWWLVDGIMILHGCYKDGDGNKLSKKPTKTSTALLCFFSLFVGTHRFYTGHYGIAWLQIALAFIWVGYIWGLVDFIMILSGKFKDANGNLITE